MNEAAAQATPSKFNLHQVYTKDVSFESPQSPAVFTWKDYRPDTEVDLKAQYRDLILHWCQLCRRPDVRKEILWPTEENVIPVEA